MFKTLKTEKKKSDIPLFELDKVTLSTECGLPLHILEYFEAKGMFEASAEMIMSGSAQSIMRYRAKFAASMRELGFTLDQIVSVVLSGKFNLDQDEGVALTSSVAVHEQSA